MKNLRVSSAPTGKKQSMILRLCIGAGIAGPIVFVLLFTIAGFLYPGYSPISQVISTLGASGPFPGFRSPIFLFLACYFSSLLLVSSTRCGQRLAEEH